MSKIYELLVKINHDWDRGKFNVLKGLRLLTETVQGSDLLPGNVTMDTLKTLALSMYKTKRSFDEDIRSLRVAGLHQNNPLHLSKEELVFMAPKESSIMDTGQIFSNLVELKYAGPTLNCVSGSDGDPIFIETLTASERMKDQLLVDESVTVESVIYKRTPCCKGRPGDGYVGCVLYQIDDMIAGTLGVYLSKAEVEQFRKSGSMPLDADSRVCILCYSQMLTCRAALFGVQGVGRTTNYHHTMFYQDLVNCNNGYQSQYMILPGSGGIFPPAPFLSFHPRQLRINMQGKHLYVDESSMWFRPNSKGFRQGVAC